MELSEPFVRRLEAFGSLSREDKACLRDIAAEAHPVDAHTDLLREGEPPNGVILVLQGYAARYKILTKGSRQIIAYLLPGDFCNFDVALLTRMDHTIGTLSACKVVRIAPSAASALLQRPAVARALRMAALLETANAREWLVNMGQRNARERVAHLICELLSRMEVIGAAVNNQYYMPLTQQELAEAVGLSPVHMNRTIRDLTKARIITLRHKRMTILDLPALKILGDFQPDYLR